ncbi:hypothetical protein NTE_00899 [Candidatus Nitrososphaera evergladensis SR1]|uniref:Uncharacterized protein n=1 Tax=Candidatus Nitrososphaera evergladensis SR1 TaxID=1459636 RepID=A0A075MP91_9ARCH|nr:hypothetical protein NTE_00899 [Candidatus Nitrososphaera evergladensis SR1]
MTILQCTACLKLNYDGLQLISCSLEKNEGQRNHQKAKSCLMRI